MTDRLIPSAEDAASVCSHDSGANTSPTSPCVFNDGEPLCNVVRRATGQSRTPPLASTWQLAQASDARRAEAEEIRPSEAMVN